LLEVMTDSLKAELRALLEASNGRKNGEHPSKDAIRVLYAARRASRLEEARQFLERNLTSVAYYFADGTDITPGAISPTIQRIDGPGLPATIFRVATLLWSVPASQGFGRRTRFLVWDSANARLIGVFALGDPVFNLGARDKWIGWTAKDRMERLSRVADAYVLGSVPPYSAILGGKLVASLIATDEVRELLREKYVERTSIIKKRRYGDHVLFSTSSALGRSSVYNRVRLRGQELFEPVGWTSGFGHFQIPNEMFARLREVLRETNHPYADGHAYGTGPNWRMRVIRAAVSALGLNDDELLNHGVKRQVFGIPLASNFREVLRGDQDEPMWTTEAAEVRARAALERWVLPRAERRPAFRQWRRSDMLNEVLSAAQHGAKAERRAEG